MFNRLSCFVCVGRHICVHIFEFLYSHGWYTSDACLRFQMVSGHLDLFSPLLSISFPLVFLSASQMEEDPFNPDYVEVDRVLEVSYCEDKDTREVKRILFHLVIISVSSVCVFIFIYGAWTHFSFFSVL